MNQIVLNKKHRYKNFKDKRPSFPYGTEWRETSTCCSGIWKNIRKEGVDGNEWEYQGSLCDYDCLCLLCGEDENK
jgi:hypothetical protein